VGESTDSCSVIDWYGDRRHAESLQTGNASVNSVQRATIVRDAWD
jgi:hypothetical protein